MGLSVHGRGEGCGRQPDSLSTGAPVSDQPMLHVHTGDCAAEALRAGGVEGVHTVWTDLLMLGPLRPAGDPEGFRAERATHLSLCTGGARTPEQCLEHLRRQDVALEQWRQHDETVLWVDGCLYDQAILVRLLQLFSQVPEALPRLRLICLDRYPGIAEFHGLGQLAPAQLAALLPTRRAVTEAQMAWCRTAWQAFCSVSPVDIEALSRQPTEPLPCLKAALRRWLEQYPSTENGLCRLQQEVLTALQAHGEQSPVELFARVSALERPAFFGDTLLWKYLNDMAFCFVPLVRLDPSEPLSLWGNEGIQGRRVRLTPEGLAVAEGRCDAIALNGIDRWLGGVHLCGASNSPWRWSRRRAALEPGA